MIKAQETLFPVLYCRDPEERTQLHLIRYAKKISNDDEQVHVYPATDQINL